MILCKENNKEYYKRVCLELEYKLYLKDKEIKRLNKENDNLRNTIMNDDYTIKKLIEANKDVCGRNKKAIKYIKENRDYWKEWHYDGTDIDIEKDINDIENILKGEDNEEN